MRNGFAGIVLLFILLVVIVVGYSSIFTVNQTDQALQPLLNALEAWFDHTAATQPDTPLPVYASASTYADAHIRLQVQLHRLSTMLLEMDGDAHEFLASLPSELTALLPPDTLNSLRQQVAAFNFEHALALLAPHLATPAPAPSVC